MRMRFVVHGIVQGVNFRNAAAGEARRLGITGRIWNRSDGAVECVAEGDDEALARFRAWLGHGPPLAQVERVDGSLMTGDRAYGEFAVARER